MKNKDSENVNQPSTSKQNGTKTEVKEEDCEDKGSSSDSVLEIRLNELIKKSEISDFDIRALVVKCSSCGRQINHFAHKEVKPHRKLGVITCKECYEFYGSSEFSQDESGYNYCTWCGNGGKLIVCDFCPNGFCSSCIRRNFGRAEISVTTAEGWRCYCCNKRRLKPKVNFCNFIRKYETVKREKKSSTISQIIQNDSSKSWLLSTFEESDEVCDNFHKKMLKLKSIGLTNSKSLKHIVSKMEELINNHKSDLKNLVKSLSRRYATHIEIQLKKEKKSNEADTFKTDPNCDNSENIDKNFDKSVEVLTNIDESPIDCINLEEDASKDIDEEDNAHKGSDHECDSSKLTIPFGVTSERENIILSDSSVSLLGTKACDVNKSQEEKIQAKLLLLKSSSDSDDCDDEPKPDIPAKLLLLKSSSDSDCDDKLQTSKEASIADNDHCDEPIDFNNESVLSDRSEGNHSEESESIVSEKKKPVKYKGIDSYKRDAKRKLSFSFSDSSDSGFEIKSDLNEIEKALYKKEISTESLDPETDPKLKLQAKVVLPRLDLFENGEPFVNITDNFENKGKSQDRIRDEETERDKFLDRLCKLPIPTKPKTKIQENPKNATVSKAPAKKVLLESSSSSAISLSSDEDEDQKKIQIPKKVPCKEKLAKKDSSSSEDSSSDLSLGSNDEDEKKPKKSNAKKKGSDDSSDDFQPVRKRKYDKLLHGPLFSDEEKKPKEKKEAKVSRKRKVLSSEEEKKEKKKSSDSTETSSSENEREKKKRQKKKRRRVKVAGSSSEEEGEGEGDDPSEDTPGKKRKNIRKIVSQKKLAVTTKEAQLEEKERRKRIQERQKLYNKIEDMSVDGKEIVTRKMVLEVDQNSKEEVVEIHPDLVCKLKPHQVNGVKFMWECTIESVKDLNKPGSGCILAHCMGLGKTLQVIAFLHTCLTNPIVSKTITRCMIICPYNTALNWASEFDYWLNNVEKDVTVHQLTSVKTNLERLDILKYWFSEGGVIILSYDIFRRLASGSIKMKSIYKKKLAEYLLDPGPHIVVCDEGHILKNEKSAISIATTKLATRRRIVLTGTPLQNNLREYHCMVSFVKPNLLGTVKEFRNRFVNPIINGQYDDSNDYDVKLMKKRIHILHKLLEGCVQRCDYSALTKFLPAKHEFVISVKLSEVQAKMYECYLEKLTNAKKDSKVSGNTLFIDFNNLRCIWTHPYICHTSHQKQEYKRMFKEDNEEEEEFINDDSDSESAKSTSGSTSDDNLIEKIEADQKKEYRTRSKVNEGDVIEEEEEIHEGSKQWYHEFISDDDKYNIELSGKMVLLMEILKECETIGDKIILFSQSLLALDAIEDILSYTSSQPMSEIDKINDIHGTWIKGLDYFRMDGTTSADFRKSHIDIFNDSTNERARLFLISTRAGSLGTNLVGANRVIIFDTSWNPSHDVQAIFRVYRFGQVKPVYIYRLLAQGTMEEKIYDRQVTKLSLSCRVVDEQQIDRHFSAADLAELYSFDRNATTNRPTPMVPKDRLLAELLIKKKDWIVTYHEHDSLLQHQTAEDLTEEERQSAWTEYENEREGRLSQDTGLGNIDLSNEPDFTEDYEGKVIPDISIILSKIFEQVKAEAPEAVNTLHFKRKVLSSMNRVRELFQGKHVTVLRQKQEYCARGTVPNSLNKYMDELANILRSSTEYVNKLSEVIRLEEAKIAQASMQARFQANYRAATANIPSGVRLTAQQQRLFLQMQARGQVPMFVRANAPYRTTYMPRPSSAQMPPNTTAFRQNTQTYSRNKTQSQPKITEVDDNAPTPAQTNDNENSNLKHTVIIEEIS